MSKKRKAALSSILQHYGVTKLKSKPFNQEKKDKVWVIYNKQRPKYILKRSIKPKKIRFPVLLQERLHKKGIAPKLILTKDQQRYVTHQHEAYFLSAYVSGLRHLPLKKRTRILAQFHARARFKRLRK